MCSNGGFFKNNHSGSLNNANFNDKLKKYTGRRKSKFRVKLKKKYNTRKVTPEFLIRNSIEYRLWRKNVYKKDNHTCQICGRKNVRLNAHHIRGFASYIHLRTTVSNGITLCSTCHFNFHKKYGKESFPVIYETSLYKSGIIYKEKLLIEKNK